MRKKAVNPTDAQKHEFGKMLVEDNYSIEDVMGLSGASKSAVSRWKSDYLEYKQKNYSKQSGFISESDEIKFLKKKLARAERDITILKKAAALFSQGI